MLSIFYRGRDACSVLLEVIETRGRSTRNTHAASDKLHSELYAQVPNYNFFECVLQYILHHWPDHFPGELQQNTKNFYPVITGILIEHSTDFLSRRC